MKNIHLIPTDKPTRLYYNGTSYKDANSTMAMDWYISSAGYKPQNIYITSNEQIKDVRPHKGKWQLEQGLMLYKLPTYLTDLLECKLVIMTTDQDLIKDGVQAIDDEFLEWFVNNPSCEEVETKVEFIQTSDNLKDGFYYRIIIPNEEPKQETTLKELLLQLRNTPMTFVPKEEYIKCGDCNKYYLCTTCGAQCGSEGHFIESTKQETTLDEAANRYFPFAEKIGGETYIAYKGFKAGAEWQAERSYSKKEVLAMLIIKHDGLSAEYVLEQFKKK